MNIMKRIGVPPFRMSVGQLAARHDGVDQLDPGPRSSRAPSGSQPRILGHVKSSPSARPIAFHLGCFPLCHRFDPKRFLDRFIPGVRFTIHSKPNEKGANRYRLIPWFYWWAMKDSNLLPPDPDL